MTKRISAEEKAIIDYVESNDSASVDNLDTEMKRYTEIASVQMRKYDSSPSFSLSDTLR
jgi:hypothetical protein